MGVKGLTTYINNNRTIFLKDYLLHNTNLIIDGHCLCAQLYRLSRCLSAFGGDYDKYASYTKNFMKNLQKCNITCYVLFDGSHEGRKLKTVHARLRSKINGASRLDPVTQGSLQIFPLLFRDVFIEVLKEMRIPYTVCEFEADDEIATMARHLGCPVLSYDSDFFIYNVQYIPFNTLELKPRPLEVNGTKTYVLECKFYEVQNLTSHFGGLKDEMLPLLATLLGNDYVEKRVFNKFFSQLKMPKSKRNKNEQQRSIHGLFKWLQNESLDSAISKILGRLKKNQKDKVFHIIKKSISGYSKKQCRSLQYFQINEDVIDLDPVSEIISSLEISEKLMECEDVDIDLKINDYETNCNDDTITDNDEIKSSDDNLSDDAESEEDEDIEEVNELGLPNWFANGIRLNNVPKPLINLYTHHLHLCSPQAEDYTDEDSCLCSLPILRYTFDLLTDYEHDYCIYVCREKDHGYRRMFVDKEYSIPRPFDTSFPELDDDKLKSCFTHFIKTKMHLLDLDVLELLPCNFRLEMLSMLWWIANCKVPLAHVHSMFICYIMLDVIDEKTGMFRGHHFLNNKYSKRLEEIKKRKEPRRNEKEELFLNKNKVVYEDCLLAASVLLKHFEIDDSIKKRPKSYDVRKIHIFAQFQCCMLQFNCLNILCNCPYEPTVYQRCFNGTFAYNLVLKMENILEPSVFVHKYLRGASTVLHYYRSLCTVFKKCMEMMSLETVALPEKKRRKNKYKRNSELEEVNFIVKGFESEVVI